MASIVAIVAAHAPLVGYATFANVDEAYAGAIAKRLVDGARLYDGAVSQRGPLMYYLYEALARLHGWDDVVALRAWALALSLAHWLLVGWVARRLLSGAAAVAATALTAYALCFGFPPFDAYALHGETLQVPLLLVSALLGARGVRAAPGSRVRFVSLASAGVLLGAAIAIKQSAIVHPLPVLAWLAIDARRRRTPVARALLLDASVLVGATLVVPLAFVAHAARQGTLARLWYFCVTYNRDVHLRPMGGSGSRSSAHFAWLVPLLHRLVEHSAFFLLLAALAAFAVPVAARRVRAAARLRSLAALGRGFGVVRYLALHFVLALAVASSMDRFFPHYFLQAWPFGALVAGSLAARALRRRAALGRSLAVALLALVVFVGAMRAWFGERVDGEVAHDRSVKTLARYIAGTTAPDDAIFVWGFSPWLYGYSHRKPAGRYVFSTYVTGFVPWFWEAPEVERARIVPGSAEELVADLERERPAIVVDAGSVMIARPMRAYEPFARLLRERYCFELRYAAFDVYRRKPGGASCAVPWAPRPHAPVDMRGRPLPDVREPRPVDDERTLPLPVRRRGEPTWLPGAPEPARLDLLSDERRDREDAAARERGLLVDDPDWSDEAQP